ncbi:MAG: iron complex outermembrane receptor protein [Sulfurimonas sp.]|jgi:iron complex outermembrane receptor protein
MNKIILGSIVVASFLYAESTVYDLGRVEVVDSNDVSLNKTTETVGTEVINDTDSKTVVEALVSLPGVSLLKTGRKNQTDVRIRGFTREFVPIYVDGIPVYTPYDRQTDLGRYTTYDVSEISVSKGYVSPMFGPNTLGGAVNIVTKKPTKEFEGEIGAGIFSGNGKEQHLTLGTNQGKYYALLSLSNYERDYFSYSSDFHGGGLDEDAGKADNSSSEDKKLNLKVGYTPNSTDEYSFNYIMQRASKDNLEYASDIQWGDEWKKEKKWKWPDWDKTSYYFISKTQFDNITLKTRLYYDKFYNKLVAYTNDSYDTEMWSSEYDDYSIGANVELGIKMTKAQTLKLAITQKNDYHTGTDLPDDEGYDINIDTYTQSLGLEYALQVNKKLKWVLGASYDKNGANKAEYRTVNSATGDTTGVDEYDNYDTDAISPQTALYYQHTDNLMLYTAVGQRTNMPSISQRYSSTWGTNEPNPDLKAEKSMNYEIGSEYVYNKQHSIKSALYYSKITDYIDYVGLGYNVTIDGKTYEVEQNQNIGDADQVGIDLSIDSYWNNEISSNIAYGYVKTNLSNSDNNDVKYVIRIPDHTLSARLKYTPTEKWAFIPSIQYQSETYTDNESSSNRTPSFIVGDVKVKYNVTKSCEVSAAINNVTDENYYYTFGYPEEGRNYSLAVNYTF